MIGPVFVALVLLVGAGLLVRSFQGLLNINESYTPTTLLTMNMTLPETQYGTEAQRLAFHEQVRERVSEIPGIQEAALVSHLPYSEGGFIGTQDFSIEGRPLTQRDRPSRS